MINQGDSSSGSPCEHAHQQAARLVQLRWQGMITGRVEKNGVGYRLLQADYLQHLSLGTQTPAFYFLSTCCFLSAFYFSFLCNLARPMHLQLHTVAIKAQE